MAETKQNGWKQTKYGGKGECWPCSVSALLIFPILFCQTVNFLSAKPPNSVLPSLCTILLCHTVLPVSTLGKNCWMMTQKQAKMKEKSANMAENKQKWLKTYKLGRKLDKIWRKRGMLAMFCFCTFKLSNSFLPNSQFLFCQANQFCSAKLNIFARGGQGPPGPPPKNAYGD